MAAWTTTWKPSYVYPYGPTYRTVISRFESGKEQRRQKWSSPRHAFNLTFNALASSTADAIRVFFDARAGSYDTFTYPNFPQYVSGTGLACTNDNPDTITDSDSGLAASALGFVAAQNITVAGSGASNDGVYTIAGVAAGTITLIGGDSLSAESSNADLVIYRTYTVRFNADQFMQEFMTPTIAGIRRIMLIEVI